ncbi:MAG: NUDIX domain-containing protein [Salibacteraceae bacterium]
MTNKNLNPNVSVDCAVFGFHEEQLKVLLIEQKAGDGGNLVQLALPGDLVLENEDLDQAASRVLKELTSLKGIYLKQFQAFGHPDRVRNVKDQEWLRSFRDNPEARVITIAYYSLVKMEDYEPSASSFAGKVVWEDIHNIPQLAFDHNEILSHAYEHLKGEILDKPIGFELLPEKFTLSQLQRLYEVVLDRKLDKRNFRKKLKKMDQVVALDEKQTGVLHKPAQLYTFHQNGSH